MSPRLWSRLRIWIGVMLSCVFDLTYDRIKAKRVERVAAARPIKVEKEIKSVD